MYLKVEGRARKVSDCRRPVYVVAALKPEDYIFELNFVQNSLHKFMHPPASWRARSRSIRSLAKTSCILCGADLGDLDNERQPRAFCFGPLDGDFRSFFAD